MENNQKFAEFCEHFAPWGTLDIGAAIATAESVGESATWAAEQVQQYYEDTGVQLCDIDPVSCVYDSILQESRNEISDLCDFDFVNDGAEIWTAGNYLATSYDWSGESPKKIAKVLKKCKIDRAALSLKTQWFLSQIGA